MNKNIVPCIFASTRRARQSEKICAPGDAGGVHARGQRGAQRALVPALELLQTRQLCGAWGVRLVDSTGISKLLREKKQVNMMR